MEQTAIKKSWWKESVVYQIYPRSYQDSDGDGIGDIKGITSRLDYLAWLGIDVIWLSPIYKSPNDDNGYDISNYRDIMTEFGTMEDFDELLQEAHKRKLKIMLDLVVNHSSDEHEWFVESRRSKENKYRDYYIWRDGKEGKEPNNWGSVFGGSAWQYDETTEQYYLHLFSKKQPDLNWDNPELRDEVFRMMTWWLEKGVDGFRMDVISMISKVPDLPDGNTYGGRFGDFGPYAMNGPHVHDYLQEMNHKVLSKFDVITVGEAPGVNVEQAKQYAGFGTDELNMIFQFEHMGVDEGEFGKWTKKPLDLCKLKEILSKWQTGLNGQAWNSLFWDNHDQPRIVSRWGNDTKYHDVSAKMLATCLHMMQGTPYIYQGEEIGMTNAGFDDISEYRDIEALNMYDEFVHEKGISEEETIGMLKKASRDNARTPMQWDATEHGGFTTGTPWINENANYKEINVANERDDQDSVLHYYKDLIRLRKENEIIVYGDYELLLPDDKNIFAYKRSLGNRKLYVFCNFSEDRVSYDTADLSEASILFGNYKETQVGTLKPYEAVVYLCE